MQIAVFVVALIAVFALKSASIVLASDDALWKSTSFSWLKPTAEDAVIDASQTMAADEAAPRVAVPTGVRVYGHRRPKVA